MNLRFYLFVSGVNQGNKEGRRVHDFSVLPQGVRELSLSLFASEMA